MKKPTSSKPGKQRKWRAQAPLHAKGRMIASPLSRELRTKYKRKTLRPRKGDVVQVACGEFSGTQGEVTLVDVKKAKIKLAGVTQKKADGTEVEKFIDPSNVVLTELYMEDARRREILERKLK